MNLVSSALAFLMIAGLLGDPLSEMREEPTTIWALPLDNPAEDETLDDLARAISDLLALAFARSDDFAVVERKHLDAVLQEHALLASALAEKESRSSIGRLLGAQWMLHGTIVRRGTALWIAVHLTEVESSRVLASDALEVGPAELERLEELSRSLMSAAAEQRTGRDGDAERDPYPETNLHFLRGLSHYHSAQYHKALAEFLRSGSEPGLEHASRLWKANCYLGLQRYQHALLELLRLQRDNAPVDRALLEERIALCSTRLSPDELRSLEQLSEE